MGMFSSLTGFSKSKPKVCSKSDEKKEPGCFETISPKTKMLAFAIFMGVVMIIHLLPVGNSFFQKIGAIRRFVHGDLTKEADTWQKQNSDLKKQLEESQNLAR